jgi:type VI secretion system secreted protein Hcp
MAAVDFFLKIDGIEGESQDAKHKGSIDIESWSWGCANLGTMAAGGGGGAGKVSMHDFTFSMPINKATPKLIQCCAGGDHIGKAVLTCRKAGGDQKEYLKITFSDVLVSSYHTGAASGSPIPHESISLNFSKVEFGYQEQDSKGNLGGAILAGWDLKLNKKV